MNPFKAGTQNYRILEALQRGPVTNADIVRDMGIFNSTGRISDLRKRGFDVQGRQLVDGLWEYKLINNQNREAVNG